ncbi:MAG: virulence protein RhuM/Fic/DOC family protein [Proteobacteria bacterium]|nr:virulence protein RhuM/Fic/DOC family protein [Pseudomonadota bacterium]
MNELVLFESSDGAVKLNVQTDRETVWLNRAQLAELFGRDVKTIGKHIGNALKEELDGAVVAKFATTAADGKNYQVEYYNLDMVISVGYRVKSQRGVEFRRWANSVLRQYIMEGYAVNQRRLKELGNVIRILRRNENALDVKQVLTVIERYTVALDMLDDYDHGCLRRPKGHPTTHVLTYEECRCVIDSMRFSETSDLFGKEKDDSFRGSIGNIYQSFGGQEIYPTMEEKAANLLYFLTKNHSFLDGNKRIAATLFLHFLNQNGALFVDGEKCIEDRTLAALTILIAESCSEEKETMISVIMNCMVQES